MAVGSGSTTLRHLPDLPFRVDPQEFALRTRRNVRPRARVVHPGGGASFQVKIPQTGVLGFIRATFVGQAIRGGPWAITWPEWPYGIVEQATLRLNGSNELWSLSGTALHAHRFVRFPAFEDATDVFPGVVGGSTAVSVPAGAYPIYLTYDFAIPVDPQWLGASIFMQSSAIDCELRMDMAPSGNGTSTGPATITGEWFIEPWHYEVPFNEAGELIVPDVGRLHGVNSVSKTFTGTGEVEVPLIRSAGQLHRLFVQVDEGPNLRMSAHPATANAHKIDGLRLEYAGNQVPYNFAPASSLIAGNNEAYGAPVPYEYMVLDLVRENTLRDPIELQGVTDLRLIVDVNSAANVTAGRVTVIQETLF